MAENLRKSYIPISVELPYGELPEDGAAVMYSASKKAWEPVAAPRVITRTLSRAELLALHLTPVTVLPPAPPGKAIVVATCILTMRPGVGNLYTVLGGTVFVQCRGGEFIVNDDLLAQDVVTVVAVSLPSTITSFTLGEIDDFGVTIASSQALTDGDGELDVTIIYYTITVG